MLINGLLLLASVFPFVAAQGECIGKRVERYEVNEEDLPPIWPVLHAWDCSSENIDAATKMPDEKIYFFKGEYYWRVAYKKRIPDYPRLIAQDWDGLPGHLDAALTWKDGRTFFFKGAVYWSFHGKTMDPGYPRNISEGFCGIPDDIDAAMLWTTDNKAYFFKGSEFWRFDGGESCTPVSAEYPKSISSFWNNIPNNIDDALPREDGWSLFFKGGYYHSFTDHKPDIGASPPLPLHGFWGKKCEELACRVPNKPGIKLEAEKIRNTAANP